MKNKIAIFGSGLSALYVYAACLDNGWNADFYTDRAFSNRAASSSPSPLPGPVKLDWVPASIKLERQPIWLFSMGSVEEYLLRMGRDPKIDSKTTFPISGRQEIYAYNPVQFFEKLKPNKHSEVILGRFSDTDIFEISKLYKHTFVTFPLKESFSGRELVRYWIFSMENSMSLSMPNMVIYNATQNFAWTRFTHYWGKYMWEYSHTEYPVTATPVQPPRPNSWADPVKIFDIAPNTEEYKIEIPSITAVGRWARWNKKVLAQDAYWQAEKILKEL